jgi:hypothetical protein
MTLCFGRASGISLWSADSGSPIRAPECAMAISVEGRFRGILGTGLERGFQTGIGCGGRLRAAPRSWRPWERARCLSDVLSDENEENTTLLRLECWFPDWHRVCRSTPGRRGLPALGGLGGRVRCQCDCCLTGMRTTPDCFAPQEPVQNDRTNPFCDRCDQLRIATEAPCFANRSASMRATDVGTPQCMLVER